MHSGPQMQFMAAVGQDAMQAICGRSASEFMQRWDV